MPGDRRVALLAAVPTTAATARLLAGTWTRPTYAHLDLGARPGPGLRTRSSAIGGAPRRTVLTYEDWSSLVYFLAGEQVVGLVPAGFAKLAYDPAMFTGRSQTQRRADLGRAFSGSIEGLTTVADAYGAPIAIVARREGRWGLLDVSAALADRTGPAEVVAFNGWDGVRLAPGGSIAVGTRSPAGPARLEIRATQVGQPNAGVPVEVTISLAGGAILGAALTAPGPDGWSRIALDVELPANARLELAADGDVVIQGIRGFVAAPAVPPGWRIATETRDAVVLERISGPAGS